MLFRIAFLFLKSFIKQRIFFLSFFNANFFGKPGNMCPALTTVSTTTFHDCVSNLNFCHSPPWDALCHIHAYVVPDWVLNLFRRLASLTIVTRRRRRVPPLAAAAAVIIWAIVQSVETQADNLEPEPSCEQDEQLAWKKRRSFKQVLTIRAKKRYQ